MTKGADMSPPFTCLSIALSPSSNGIRQTPPPTSMGAAARIVDADARAGAVPPQRPTRVCGEKGGGSTEDGRGKGAGPSTPPNPAPSGCPSPGTSTAAPPPSWTGFSTRPRSPSTPRALPAPISCGGSDPGRYQAYSTPPPHGRGFSPPHEGGSFTPANSSQAAPRRPSQPSLPFPIFLIDGQIHCLPRPRQQMQCNLMGTNGGIR